MIQCKAFFVCGQCGVDNTGRGYGPTLRPQIPEEMDSQEVNISERLKVFCDFLDILYST